jgi:lysophospholipase L1-like esterase
MGAKAKIGLGIVVLALVAGGLWWWLRPTPVRQGVVFVGDSVTYISLDDLNRDVGAKHPAYLTRVGYRSTDLLPLLQLEVARKEQAGEPLSQIALLVGYNDVLKDDVESPALPEMMNLAAKFHCAVWLTLPDVPLHKQETSRWNDRVRAAAKGHRNVHVLETWRKAVDSAPAGTLLVSDGVHPNAAGAARLTSVYLDTIGKFC